MKTKEFSELKTPSEILSNTKCKKKLIGFAKKQLRKKSKFQVARHLTAEDILFTVISKLLTNEIIWNSEKCFLIDFFFLRISSEVANLVKKEQKFIPVSWEELEPWLMKLTIKTN